MSKTRCRTVNGGMEEYIKEALQQQFIRPSTPWLRAFSSWERRRVACGPASTTGPLMNIFSKLDLHSAYNLVPIWEGNEWKTAFITPSGHYEYQVMPYGLSNSPSVFQGFMYEVFREFLHKFVLIYIDDILIYSPEPGQTSPLHHAGPTTSQETPSLPEARELLVSPAPRCTSSDTSSVQMPFRWTRGRPKLSVTGPNLRQLRNSNDS